MKPQLTIEAFADWCEKQPAEKGYDYQFCHECACGLYAAQFGIDYNHMFPTQLTPFWRRMDRFAEIEPHTFGALASRLRAQA